jgi:HK97 family phage prohead protease
MQTRSIGLEVKTINESGRSIDCIASTETVDSYGDIVEQVWNLQRYLANPVVLFAHNSRELPIGHAENVRVESGALRARIIFATADANPKAEQVWQSVRQKTLRGVSVGFYPNAVREEKRDGRSVLVLSDNELHEISVVPVPANPDAVMRAPGHSASRPTNSDTELVALMASPADHELARIARGADDLGTLMERMPVEATEPTAKTNDDLGSFMASGMEGAE